MIDMVYIIEQLQKWWNPSIYLCFICGLFFVVLGLSHFALAQGNMGHGSRNKRRALAEIIIGIMMINFPAVLETLSQSILVRNTITDLSFAPPDGPAKLYIQFSLYVINLVGVYGVWKGLLQFGQHEPLIGKGFTYLIGGSMAVNFVELLRALGNTFGGIIQDTVTAIVG